MNITKTTLEPKSIFTKEMRQLKITGVTKDDREELHEILAQLGFMRWNHTYRVLVNNTLCSFMTQQEAWHFSCGFTMALQLGGTKNLSSHPVLHPHPFWSIP
jgi:hypothetical protein